MSLGLRLPCRSRLSAARNTCMQKEIRQLWRKIALGMLLISHAALIDGISTMDMHSMHE